MNHTQDPVRGYLIIKIKKDFYIRRKSLRTDIMIPVIVSFTMEHFMDKSCDM